VLALKFSPATLFTDGGIFSSLTRYPDPTLV
jgi:hypothetical protein